MRLERKPPLTATERSLPEVRETARLFKGQHRRVCRQSRVRRRFRKRLPRLLRVRGPRPVLLQFLRPRAAVVSPVLEGVSPPAAHRGEAAAGAGEARGRLLPDQQGTRPPVAEAATRTDAQPVFVLVLYFSGVAPVFKLARRRRAGLLCLFPNNGLRKNHSRITDDRVPVTIHITRRCIPHDFAARYAEFFHCREHHNGGPPSAHGEFLLAADLE